MSKLTRMMHGGLDRAFMEAFRLRRLHPPRLDLGPLLGKAHLPAGGIPKVTPLWIDLPRRTRTLTFLSPVAVAAPPNDQMTVRLYPARGPTQGFLLLSPFWQVPGAWALRSYIKMARRLGLCSVVYSPPDHMERTPAGYWSGERLLSWDLPYMESMLQLAAAELTAVTLGLKRHGLPVYLLGMSLGGLYAAMAALNGAPVDALLLLTPAADMQESMARSTIGRRYQGMLRKRGDAVPDPAFLSVVGRPYRARTFDRPLPAQHIFLAHGTHDGVVPLDVVAALARRWRVPMHAYACGHLSLLFLEPLLLKDVSTFLAGRLKADPLTHAALDGARVERRMGMPWLRGMAGAR